MHSATNYQLWLASGIHELDDGPQIISWECCTLGTNFWCGKLMWCGRRMLWVAFMGGWELWGSFSSARSSGCSFLERWVQFAEEGVWRKGRRRGSKRRSWMLKIEWKRAYLRYVRACRQWIQMNINSERRSIFLCILVFKNFKSLTSSRKFGTPCAWSSNSASSAWRHDRLYLRRAIPHLRRSKEALASVNNVDLFKNNFLWTNVLVEISYFCETVV